jgi:DNA (cytosine-5)-methyltransferase 1
MTAYYNEFDPRAAQWLRELIREGLIAPGVVDERSIEDVQPDDLVGFTQAHFFAGIGGWSYALRLAGWPDDRAVWTGSCPCQPFSGAARGRATGLGSSKDLWPAWFRLISAAAPSVVFGEQVPKREWIDRLCNDMEAVGYQVGAAIMPACSIGADHVRERAYFVCHANSDREPVLSLYGEVEGVRWNRSFPDDVVPADGIPHRMAVMRGFGNAIVPQVAAEFVWAFHRARVR